LTFTTKVSYNRGKTVTGRSYVHPSAESTFNNKFGKKQTHQDQTHP
jgi:hypothetical protein